MGLSVNVWMDDRSDTPRSQSLTQGIAQLHILHTPPGRSGRQYYWKSIRGRHSSGSLEVTIRSLNLCGAIGDGTLLKESEFCSQGRRHDAYRNVNPGHNLKPCSCRCRRGQVQRVAVKGKNTNCTESLGFSVVGYFVPLGKKLSI
jgi:hypothetical protein